MTGHKDKKPVKIVVVEDEEEDVQLLLRQLERSGYQNEADFRAALKPGEVDIVFSDYLLPAFNAQSALQVYNESGLDVPFLVVSGVIGEETAVDMVSAGANDYLLKENLLRLSVVVERELRDSQIRREHRLLREQHFREGVKESSAGTSIRVHLEAIRRMLSQIKDPANRDRLNALLQQLEEFAAESLTEAR